MLVCSDLHWVALVVLVAPVPLSVPVPVPVPFNPDYEINRTIKTQCGKHYAQKSKAQQEWN
jgi:hypothetical protein